MRGWREPACWSFSIHQRTFYGTTNYGGNSSSCTSCGTVYSLSTGLSPFVKALPNAGNVGRVIHRHPGKQSEGRNECDAQRSGGDVHSPIEHDYQSDGAGGCDVGNDSGDDAQRDADSSAAFVVP